MASKRLHWIDNLKVFLSLIVVIHHCGRAYGTWTGWWFIKEEITTGIITPFFAIDAAFLMSIFFFLAAYFMPGTYDRKGQPTFGSDRNKRLLIPLIFFLLVVMPIQTYFYYIHFRGYEYLNFFEYYILVYFGIGGQPSGWTGPNWPDLNLGHIWFLEHLLFYGLFYVLIKEQQKKKAKSRAKYQNIEEDVIENKNIQLRQTIRLKTTHLKSINLKSIRFPKTSELIALSVLLGIVTFVVRIWHPFNEWTAFLYVYQVEWGHWPHYLVFVLLGIAAYRHGWLKKENFARIAPFWILISVICLTLFIITSIYVPIDSNYLQGGFTWTSLVYSVIEVFFLMGMFVSLIYAFQKYFDSSSKPSKFLSKHSYLVYLFHQPVVILVQYALFGLNFHPFYKFLLTISIGLPLSFFVAWLIKKTVPYARKYL
ncbi:MAG: acyltransferase family protein [Candidatus Lokiarchaeota archaeon]|nr:acyltransferase family protein [Candidatus Lokiarchaeota archaeon]